MIDNTYGEFADYFDFLNGDAQYSKRTKYMLELFQRFGTRPNILLDLACGTGEFSVAFAKKGLDVIGVDCSENMLAVARDKAQKAKQDVLFLCQRAEELDLYGTVGGAICCFDSINHITESAVLSKAFEKVSLFLEPDGLFIFDVNTVYKHKNVLGGKTFVYDEEDVYFVWNNEYKEKKHLVNIYLDIFQRIGNDEYKRIRQSITERAYTADELDKMLKKAGLEVVAVYDDMSYAPPHNESQRIYYVTKKVK